MKSKRLSHDFLVHFVDNTNHMSLSTMEFLRNHIQMTKTFQTTKLNFEKLLG